MNKIKYFLARKFRHYSLRARLIVGFVAVSLLSMGTVAIFANRTVRSNLTENVGAGLKDRARSQALEIGDVLVRQLTTLETLTLSQLIQDEVAAANRAYIGDTAAILAELDQQWRAADAADDDDPLVQARLSTETAGKLREFQALFPDHVEVFVTDKFGGLVGSTNRTSDYYQADEEWWQTAFDNGRGGTYIGNPEFDENRATFAISMAVPLYDDERETVTGVLHTTYRARVLMDLLAAVELGQTGSAELYLSNGQKLDPEGSQLAAIELDANTLAQLQEPAVNYVEFTMEGAHHLMSQALVTADVTHPEIANLGWAVVFHQERQEILAPIAAQNRTMVLVTIAIAGAVATAAVGVSRQLAGPVTRLTAVARKVAEGDLTAQAHVESGDEIGVLAVAFNNMTTQLRQTLDGLEQRVAERTHDLEQRSVYLEAAAEVSYAATSIRDLDKLLTRVTHLLSERFDFYHTGVFLLDGEGEYAVLRAASGPGGQRMLERGHQFEVGETSVVGYVTWAKEPRIAFDAGQDAVLFDNPDLPETRSEMVLPLVSGGQVLGALDIQSTEGSAFTQEDVSILQVLADQLAIAIDNAKLFAENQAALAESQAALETARRAYQGVSREGWQDLLRGRPDLGYLASTKKVAPSSQTQFTPEMAQASIKGRTIVGDAATVAVPIKIQDQTTGVVRFRKPETNGWTKSEINLLESLTDRLGTALESARLYKDTQTALVRTNALYQVGRAAITTEHIPQLLQSVANSVAESIAADEALVIALDVESQTVLHFHKNGAPTQLPTPDLFDQLMSGLTGWAIQKKQALLSPKELPDPRESQAAQQYRRDNQVGSVVIAPMTYRQKILGTITATNKMDRPDFTQADADLLAAMANQVAAALTNAELLSQTRTRALQLQTSAEVAQASSSILELDQLLPTAVEVIGERFSFYYVGIFLVDETGRWAELRAGTGKAGQVQIEQGHRLRVGGESMIGQCISTARARIAFDVGEEAVHFQNPNLPETRSEMALPLTSRGRTIGAITIQATQPTAFNQENITVFQTMAGQLAIAIRNAQLFETEQRRSQNAATLLEITQVAGSSLRLNLVLKEISQRTASVCQANRCTIFLLDENERLIPVMAQFADGHSEHELWETFKNAPNDHLDDIPVFRDAVQQRKPVLLTNAPERPDLIPPHWVEPFGGQAMLSVPLISQDQGIGIMVLDQIDPRRSFTKEQIDLAMTIAGQTATTVENARLFQQTQEALDSEKRERAIAETLAKTAEQVTQAASEKEIRQIMVEEVNNIVLPDQISLYEWDEDSGAFIVDIRNIPGHEEDDYQAGDWVAPDARPDLYEVFRSEKPLLTSERRELFVHEHYALPWYAGNEVCGVVELYHTARTLHIRPHDQEPIEGIIQQAAIAIQSARNFEQTQIALARTDALFQVSQVATAMESLPNLLQSIVDRIAETLPADRVLLITLDFDTGQVTSFVESGLPTGVIIPLSYDELSQGLTGWVIQNRKPALSPKGVPDSRESIEVQESRAGAGSIIVVPLIYRDQVLGTLTATNELDSSDFTGQDVDLLVAMANQAATAIENARLFEATQQALAEQRKLGKAIQSTADVIIITDPNGTIEFVNPAFALVTGYTGIEAIGKTNSILRSGRHDKAFYKQMWDTITTGMAWRGEITNKRKDGTLYEAQLTISPILNPRGEIVQFVAVQRDITEQKRAEEERKRLLSTLERRALQLQTAAEVSQAASSILELDELISQVVELISERFGFYYTGIFLVDDAHQWAILRAGTGEAGRTQIETGHRLRVGGGSMVGRCIAGTKAQIAQRLDEQAARFQNPYLPDTRAEMALPLVSAGQTIGAMTIQSTQPDAFTQEDIIALQTMADQLAIAIENARFIRETRFRAENERLLNQISAQFSRSLDLDTVLRTAVQELGQIANVNEVSIHT